jgi:Putative addiction module component
MATITVTPDQIEEAALALEPEARVRILEKLRRSLGLEDDEILAPEEWQQVWIAEAERRRQDLLEGRVQSIPIEDVFRELEANLP